MSINTVTVSGNLTRDCEIRHSAIGTAVVRFTVAVNERVKQEDGTWGDKPSFFDCTMFGVRADKLSAYLTKGVKVTVQGKLRQSAWESDGQKRSKVEIIADELEFMSRKEPQQTTAVYDDCPF